MFNDNKIHKKKNELLLKNSYCIIENHKNWGYHLLFIPK